jgi:transposase, IS5 family
MAADQNAQYEQYRKPTRRNAFLATMECVVSQGGALHPHYPKADSGPCR